VYKVLDKPVAVTELMFRKHLYWTSIQSDQNLRSPHVARQQQLSIDICCPRPTSAANPPAAAAVDRWGRHADRHTEGRTLDRFMTLIAYCVNRVKRNAATRAYTLHGD